MSAVLTQSKLAGLLIIGLMLVPGSASAQALPSDPPVGSPSGTIYQLPLDTARRDAAPKRPARKSPATTTRAGGSGRTDGATTTTPSALRSENGFGSSSVVPGAAASRAAASGKGRRIAKPGSASVTDAGSPAASAERRATATPAGVQSTPSNLMTYGLLALVLAAGLAAGVVTRVRRRPPG